MEKTCFKCGKLQPTSEYYAHAKMGDGYLGKCKTCTKKDVAERIKVKMTDPVFVESERRRGREKAKRLKYGPSSSSKSEVMLRYQSKYPEKKLAATACNKVKCENGFHKHHWSYNQPHWKDVIELDKSDHLMIHCYMKYDQERMMYRVSCNLGGFEFGQLLSTREMHERFIAECLVKYKPIHYQVNSN